MVECQHEGPLHTKAKGRHQEIVRARKEVSKGHLKTPKICVNNLNGKKMPFVWS